MTLDAYEANICLKGINVEWLELCARTLLETRKKAQEARAKAQEERTRESIEEVIRAEERTQATEQMLAHAVCMELVEVGALRREELN